MTDADDEIMPLDDALRIIMRVSRQDNPYYEATTDRERQTPQSSRKRVRVYPYATTLGVPRLLACESPA